MHSNIGYIVTLALNLSLLLPKGTKDKPLVDNYVLILYVSHSPNACMLANSLSGQTDIGY